MTSLVQSAFVRQDWFDVLRKIEYLTRQIPDAISADIYRMQGLAFYQRGDLKQAQEALDVALALVNDTDLRLQLLNDYISVPGSFNQWSAALELADEALQLAPGDVHWFVTRQRILMHIEQRQQSASGAAAEAVMPAYENVSTKVIGIDLGTTNSCVALIEGGEPVVVPNAEGTLLTPSVIAFNRNGEAANRQAVTNPENTIFSIKRLMGRQYDDPDIKVDRRLVPYKVVRAGNGEAAVEIQGRQYSPVEISAMILGKLKADAEAYLGERIMHAIITIPAHFNDAQRRATKEAGRICGLAGSTYHQ